MPIKIFSGALAATARPPCDACNAQNTRIAAVRFLLSTCACVHHFYINGSASAIYSSRKQVVAVRSNTRSHNLQMHSHRAIVYLSNEIIVASVVGLTDFALSRGDIGPGSFIAQIYYHRSTKRGGDEVLSNSLITRPTLRPPPPHYIICGKSFERI